MNRHELRSGATAGLLAAAATGGALIALGRKAGASVRPFNVAASHLLGASSADTFGFVTRITLTGALLHVVVVTALGIGILAIVRRRIAPLWVTCAGVSLLACLISVGFARRGLPSIAGLFPVGDLVVYYLVLMLSLGWGIRFALPRSATDGPSRLPD